MHFYSTCSKLFLSQSTIDEIKLNQCLSFPIGPDTKCKLKIG